MGCDGRLERCDAIIVDVERRQREGLREGQWEKDSKGQSMCMRLCSEADGK